VIADAPAIDGARIFGAIVPVIRVFDGFTRKCALARDADTEGTHQAELASSAILDWHAFAYALGTAVLGTPVSVVAVVGVFAFRRSTAAAIATVSTVSASTTIPTAAGGLASNKRYSAECDQADQSKQVPHRNLPGMPALLRSLSKVSRHVPCCYT
jgi:hypothetical protein